MGPHTDFGTLTILDRQPGRGGLQVHDEHGEWIDAPYVEGALVVNGDAVIEVLETCVSAANPAKYPPIRSDVYVAQNMNAMAFHD